MQWTYARLGSLSPFDVYDMLALRSEVFVVEQTCVFQDPDGVDRDAWHLLGRRSSGELVGVLRVVDPGIKYGEPSLGRVISAPSVRGTGIGRLLVQEGIERCSRTWPGYAIRISAQARLEGFYQGFGFQSVGQPYLEDDIPHVEMWRPGS